MTQIISRQRIIEAVLQALPDLVIKGVNDGVSGNNGISIGSDTKAVKAIYLVRLNAGSNNIILVKSNGDVLKININTGTTPSITFPSGGTFGEALVPATAVYSSAMI
jgi:Na+/H+ antiporter NhaB